MARTERAWYRLMATLYYHFSVDDVLRCLLDVSAEPTRLWQHSLFGFLKSIWQSFRVPTDCYLFERAGTEPDAPSLADVPSELANLLSSAPWLRFGPHARDPNTHPYAQSAEDVSKFVLATYQQLQRFASPANLTPWVRLHYFSECYEQAELLALHNVTTLLTTDKPAGCYRLSEQCRRELLNDGFTRAQGINFVRSHIRIENLLNVDIGPSDETLGRTLDELTGNAQCAVIFTHEYELERPEVRAMTYRVLEWVRRKELQPVFPVSVSEGAGA